MPNHLSRARLKRAAQYVERNLGSAISLDDLAGAVALSRYHFSRSFKCTTGMTPGQFVLAKRIEAAKRMLVETEEAIVTIAIAVGFSGQSQFTTAFKRLTGTTPRVYRRRESQPLRLVI